MTIYIENLTFKCIVGILDFERKKRQRVIVNLSFDYEFKDGSFIDYAEVSELVKRTMKDKKFKLLEDAVKTLSELIKNKYEVENLQLKISKPNILKDCVVSLSL
ncbi:dihydroneopterin aldolase [Aliarcobacter cibarius]|jgi:7,8-dihydroneopterin aldolase/epimerase/oxygenase|uniref:dihydroneopterin aldolase n=1 Tax=Aliarcobacter cibarius TaxID=255507 RepID=A0A5J6RIQ7_9BACT|nr:dihydroneopterin aldolase [Aliarcobacter cibarius]QEZ89862.1 dihydroneopterin aldolase [Aliarcobacter cibarius]QKJ27871.1 dihydroneopterin aldolase [Aliarcobacter cibarius]TLT00845.1 dihydroneopterin aldolase [Aliarcobacter cibarius]TLT01415.1 dihydroneopterin aldolase [Aliarcobacter cibarius]TLT04875.1 dihydroneopterin aldolase [Aliarcobacter cibarius]